MKAWDTFFLYANNNGAPPNRYLIANWMSLISFRDFMNLSETNHHNNEIANAQIKKNWMWDTRINTEGLVSSGQDEARNLFFSDYTKRTRYVGTTVAGKTYVNNLIEQEIITRKLSPFFAAHLHACKDNIYKGGYKQVQSSIEANIRNSAQQHTLLSPLAQTIFQKSLVRPIQSLIASGMVIDSVETASKLEPILKLLLETDGTIALLIQTNKCIFNSIIDLELDDLKLLFTIRAQNIHPIAKSGRGKKMVRLIGELENVHRLAEAGIYPEDLADLPHDVSQNLLANANQVVSTLEDNFSEQAQWLDLQPNELTALLRNINTSLPTRTSISAKPETLLFWYGNPSQANQLEAMGIQENDLSSLTPTVRHLFLDKNATIVSILQKSHIKKEALFALSPPVLTLFVDEWSNTKKLLRFDWLVKSIAEQANSIFLAEISTERLVQLLMNANAVISIIDHSIILPERLISLPLNTLALLLNKPEELHAIAQKSPILLEELLNLSDSTAINLLLVHYSVVIKLVRSGLTIKQIIVHPDNLLHLINDYWNEIEDLVRYKNEDGSLDHYAIHKALFHMFYQTQQYEKSDVVSSFMQTMGVMLDVVTEKKDGAAIKNDSMMIGSDDDEYIYEDEEDDDYRYAL